jgi:AbrB family looped-hinge helix DNA binding protein
MASTTHIRKVDQYVSGISIKIAEGGRLVIPAEHRRALGLEVGDEVIVRVEDGELRILTRSEAIKRAQALVRRHIKGSRLLVEELSAERRAEAKRE